MAGHYAPEVGRKFEDGFALLLYRLGYKIIRKRDTRTGIDIVALFEGDREYSNKHHLCTLLKPIFSSSGIVAFSLKKGNFKSLDVQELIGKIQESKNLEGNECVIIDKQKKCIDNGVMITNYTKTETEVDEILSKGIYCWDIIRLLFYANKTRICYNLSKYSNLLEVAIDDPINGSYIICPKEFNDGIMHIDVVIFIDEYKESRTISGDHLTFILEVIYEQALSPLINSKIPIELEIKNEIHILNLADKELLMDAYKSYAGNMKKHPKVTYLIDFDVFTYVSYPWYPFLQVE